MVIGGIPLQAGLLRAGDNPRDRKKTRHRWNLISWFVIDAGFTIRKYLLYSRKPFLFISIFLEWWALLAKEREWAVYKRSSFCKIDWSNVIKRNKKKSCSRAASETTQGWSNKTWNDGQKVGIFPRLVYNRDSLFRKWDQFVRRLSVSVGNFYVQKAQFCNQISHEKQEEKVELNSERHESSFLGTTL